MSINTTRLSLMKKESERHRKTLAEIDYESELKINSEYKRHKIAIENIEGGAEDAQDAERDKS